MEHVYYWVKLLSFEKIKMKVKGEELTSQWYTAEDAIAQIL